MTLETPKIDSLRLIIPFEDVTVNPLHSSFTRKITSINEDAEVIGTQTQNAYRLHENPCSSTYLKATTILKGDDKQVIKIGFSSKVLKQDYFQGINKSNIDAIYDFIISEGVITLDKETFLNALVVDTDICYDVLLKDANVFDAIKHAKTLSIPYKETRSNAFTQKTNVGIEWNERHKVGEAYKTKQYLKYYAKSLELKHNSTQFYDTYIKNNVEMQKYLKDSKLLRVETTLKNNAHWNTYGATVRTLNDLLTLDLTKHLEVFKRPINHYMSGNKFIETRTNLTPSEREKLLLIDMTIKHYDLTQAEAIEYLANLMEPTIKQNRNRYKKKLTSLCDTNRKKKILKADVNQLDILIELERLNLVPKSEHIG